MALVMSFEDYVSQYGTITLLHDTGGGGSSTAVAGYTVAALKTRPLGEVFRFDRTGVGYTIIRIDLSTSYSNIPLAVGVCGIRNVGTPSYTNPVSFRLYNTGTALNNSGTFVGQTSPSVQTVIGYLHDGAINVNRIEIWVFGTTDTIEIGRIWCGPAFQSLHSSGLMDTGPEDSGGTELTRGGQAIGRIGVVSRSVILPIPYLEPAEIFGTTYAGSIGAKSTVPLEYGTSAIGKTGPFLAFQEDPTNTMRPIYGHFIELPRFKPLAPCVYETSLGMREER